jgi:hypothetical protein
MSSDTVACSCCVLASAAYLGYQRFDLASQFVDMNGEGRDGWRSVEAGGGSVSRFRGCGWYLLKMAGSATQGGGLQSDRRSHAIHSIRTRWGRGGRVQLEPEEAQQNPAVAAFHRGTAALAGGRRLFTEGPGEACREHALIRQQGRARNGAREPELRGVS